MALTCTAAVVHERADKFRCLTPEQQRLVQVEILFQLADFEFTPATLAALVDWKPQQDPALTQAAITGTYEDFLGVSHTPQEWAALAQRWNGFPPELLDWLMPFVLCNIVP